MLCTCCIDTIFQSGNPLSCTSFIVNFFLTSVILSRAHSSHVICNILFFVTIWTVENKYNIKISRVLGFGLYFLSGSRHIGEMSEILILFFKVRNLSTNSFVSSEALPTFVIKKHLMCTRSDCLSAA